MLHGHAAPCSDSIGRGEWISLPVKKAIRAGRYRIRVTGRNRKTFFQPRTVAKAAVRCSREIAHLARTVARETPSPLLDFRVGTVLLDGETAKRFRTAARASPPQWMENSTWSREFGRFLSPRERDSKRNTSKELSEAICAPIHPTTAPGVFVSEPKSRRLAVRPRVVTGGDLPPPSPPPMSRIQVVMSAGPRDPQLGIRLCQFHGVTCAERCYCVGSRPQRLGEAMKKLRACPPDSIKAAADHQISRDYARRPPEAEEAHGRSRGQTRQKKSGAGLRHWTGGYVWIHHFVSNV
ncbi:hypothetical protein Bbelb_367950 [Branchiostoma belcheri]|nr:hypothetical protein Bbelb_367950 [Branchiostoma belcheri]